MGVAWGMVNAPPAGWAGMTYNTDRRRPLRGKARLAFLEAHGRRCWWCKGRILDALWDVEHCIAKELLPPGSDWNAPENLAPIHRRPCHLEKTALDRRLIAKSNRIRKNRGRTALQVARPPKPEPTLRGRKEPIRSRGFQHGPKRAWAKRLFQQRGNR